MSAPLLTLLLRPRLSSQLSSLLPPQLALPRPR